MLLHPPKIIALCGHPKHGKSTAQGFLEGVGFRSMDDGRPIRLEGMRRFGLTWEQVSTQNGKLEKCFAFGREMEVREALGLIGKEHESNPLHWAEIALETLRVEGNDEPVSFGSVRRTQGLAYKKVGGIVVEIVDPRKPESPYDFDQYDRSIVDFTVVNDGTLDDLRKTIETISHGYLTDGVLGTW